MWNRRAAPGAEWIKVRRPSIYLSLSLANGVSTGYERYVVDYILLTGREIPGQQKRDMFIYSFACFLFCVVCICMDSCYATACLHVVLFVTCVLWNKINEWMKQYQTWQTATTTSYKLLLVRGKKNTISLTAQSSWRVPPPPPDVTFLYGYRFKMYCHSPKWGYVNPFT